jgi:hypothetical protein
MRHLRSMMAVVFALLFCGASEGAAEPVKALKVDVVGAVGSTFTLRGH